MPRPFFIKRSDIESIIRVNHAGELGANFIYQGQIRYIAREHKETIEHMLEQELEHLEYFKQKIHEYGVRPTILVGLWKKLGYLIGAVSAKLSTSHAMLVTEAVESVIEEHYERQKVFLSCGGEEYKELYDKISKFQQDETEHKHIAIEFDNTTKDVTEKIKYYMVQIFCQFAIRVSKDL